MFRPFRRSGPPPFQVMSSTWRGATRASLKASSSQPSEPAATAGAESVSAAAEPAAATISRAAAPVVTAVAPTIAKAAEAEKPAPRATIEVRRRNDPPSSPRQGFDFSRITQPIAKGVAWLGAMTLALGALVADRAKLLRQRFTGRTRRGQPGGGAWPRQTVVLGFAALALVVMLIVWMLSDPAKPSATSLVQTNGTVQDSNLTALRPGGSDIAAAGPVAPTERRGAQAAIPFNTPDPLVPPVLTPKVDEVPRPKLSRTSTDPREKGQRYYILATYSVNKETYLMPLLEHLWSQGVEAAAINGHNSGFFQVVALQGFTRDEINNKAHRQYEETLRRIGRKWKAEGGGDDNLQGLYLQEYSGTPAKLSITKAN